MTVFQIGGRRGYAISFQKGFPPGYEAQINLTSADPFVRGVSTRTNSPLTMKGGDDVRDQLVRPDEWFRQEVIAVGNHIASS